ncbi:MAG: SnoaL-like domain [Solirubrobacterales bacterium]|jgi:ketosteroid isomerase-like protein|nr:SnoaL-like domain [Solirubrobacterales bacterium]
MEAAQAGDVEGALAGYAEDVVFHPLVAGPYHGRLGVVEQMMTWMAEFDDFWFESEEYVDAGNRVVLLWRQGGRGKASGVDVTTEGATVMTVAGGFIREAFVYADRDKALRSVGLK